MTSESIKLEKPRKKIKKTLKSNPPPCLQVVSSFETFISHASTSHVRKYWLVRQEQKSNTQIKNLYLQQSLWGIRMFLTHLAYTFYV